MKAHLSKQSDLEIDVEDSANIIFGVVINKEKEITGSLNMDFIRHDDTRICLAIGDQGSLKWDGINGQVYWFSKDRNEWELIFEESTERDFTYIKEIDHFFSSIKRKEGVMISGKDGLKVVRCVEAIRHSHERNSLVVL